MTAELFCPALYYAGLRMAKQMRRRQFVGLASGAMFSFGRRPALFTALDNRSLRQEDSRFLEVGHLVSSKMAEYRIPGVALGVFKDGRSTIGSFGLTNVDDPQPVTSDTVFPIASISKTTVVTAIMRLVEKGRVDLEAPVRRYISDFQVQDESVSREVLMWHLLTHTPGWEGQLGTPDRGSETLANFTSGLRDLPQLARPGEVWSYNNAGFGVAGRVLEVVTGTSINDALSDLVFRPLGLSHAFTRTGTAMTHRFAAGHRENLGVTSVNRPFVLPANVSAGGVAMSIASLLRYARFHVGDGTAEDGEQVLSRDSLERMRVPLLRKNSTTDEIGIGWHLRRLDGVLTAAHGGTLGGHCLHVQLVPERNLAFGILTNHNVGWRLIQDVERAILELYEGLALAPGQATGGNRGGNEDMTVHAAALSDQPEVGAYVGTYQRPPIGTVTVGAEDGHLVLMGGGAGERGVPLVFWGPDLTYTAPGIVAGYPYEGMPVEFIRNADGDLGWIRINGRIAVKDT